MHIQNPIADVPVTDTGTFVSSAAREPSDAPGKRRYAASRTAGTVKSASRVRSLFYLASWGTLGLAAGLYLSAFLLKPRFLANWLPAVDQALTLPQASNQDRSAMLADARQLRANLEQSQAEVARLRQEIGSRDAQVKSAELRISSLENELATARGNGNKSSAQPNGASVNTTNGSPALAAQTTDDGNRRALAAAIGAPTEKAHTSAARSASPQAFEIVNGAPTMVNAPAETPTFANATPGADVELPLPERRPAGLVKAKVNPITQVVRPTVAVVPAAGLGIETGSVGGQAKPADPAHPVTFGAPVVTRSANPVAIRLTAAPSIDALRLSWSLMSERYANELGGLQPRYVAGGAPAAPYALVAGPITDESEAHRRCALLIARGIPCSVDSFTGNAL